MKNIILLDGAMGTLLTDEYNLKEKTKEKINILYPEIIETIHEKYIEAGADFIKANTFNCSKEALAMNGECEDNSYIYALRGAEIAKKISSKNNKKSVGTFCLGDESQIDGILDGDTDYILIETIFDYKKCLKSFNLLKERMRLKKIDKPIMISFALNKDGLIYSGENILDIFKEFIDENTFSIGINCTDFSENILEIFRELRKSTDLKLSFHPNSNGDVELFMAGIKRCLDENLLDIVGGCCGSSYIHIEKLKKYID